MDFTEILKILGVDKLEEEKQKEVSSKISDIIDFYIKEKLEEERSKLVEEYEEKFEEYKETIVSNFSNFIDKVLEEELVIPDAVMEYARYGELYADLIEDFKARIAIDEGVLNREIKSILKEAKEEIVSLREQLNESISRELEAMRECQKLELYNYMMDKCFSLTESERRRILPLLEGAQTKEEVDRKFNFIVENNLLEKKVAEDVAGKGRHTVKVEEDDEIITEEERTPFESDLDMWLKKLKHQK